MAEGKTAEAVPVLERALAIRIAALGPDRLETAQSRQALALALMRPTLGVPAACWPTASPPASGCSARPRRNWLP